MTTKIKSDEISIAATQSAEERDYWLNQLSGELHRSNFPYDSPQRQRTNEEESYEFKLSGETFDRLMALCKGSDYTLHMILIAVISVLTNKYTDQKDVILGTPIDRQDHDGDFINTVLALRSRLKAGMSVKELLLQIRATIHKAAENQNYPIETLIYDLGLVYKENDEFPLFDIAVVLENIQSRDYIRHIRVNTIFSFLRTRECLRGTLIYNKTLFGETTIHSIVEHFTFLLEEMIFNVNLKISEISSLSEKEKEKLLVEFNETERDFPRQTIHELFREQARQNAGHTALIYKDEKTTYRELNEKTNQLARTLVKHGVKTGDIVGIMAERSVEMIVAMLGVLKAGGAYLPLDPGYPAERLDFMIRNSNTGLILTQSNLRENLQPGPHVLYLDHEELYNGEATDLGEHGNPHGRAYIIFTSGSTGMPKGTSVAHRSIANTLRWRSDYYAFDQKEVVLQIPSFSFDSSVEDIFTPFVSGSTLVLIPQEQRLNMDYIEQILLKDGITHFLIVPNFYKTFLSQIPQSLKHMKAITIAGDNFTEELVKEHFEKLPGVKLFNEYGPTENSVCTTVYHFSPENTRILIGRPIDNVKCYILNSEKQLNPLNVPGELFVAGAGLAQGYLNNPETTDLKFMENPFEKGKKMYATGDLARWLPDGNIEFLGRKDDQVKIRGHRIELGEIEKILACRDDIEQIVVTARQLEREKEENDDKYLCAYFTASREIKVTDLREYLLQKIPYYMIPAYFSQLDKMPLTPGGKIDKKALPEPKIKSHRESIAPRNPLEKKIAEIWSDELELLQDKIGINDDFFEMGGHSLKATIMIARIHKEFDSRIPLAEIFKDPTILGIARYIRETEKEKYVSIEPVEKKEYYPVSSPQKRLYVLQQMVAGNTGYNMPDTIIPRERIDKTKLESIFRKLIARHESL
ncbi:MAG: amino acid adenylation domain-containing protein, partial [bacterium]|nr:amino acid adenylation domain-containing protein [bacterium]